MILIGSRALALRAPHLLNRQPKDFDFVVPNLLTASYWVERNMMPTRLDQLGPNKYVAKGESIVEFEIDRSSWLHNLVVQDGMSTTFGLVPTLDMLFTLKQSHRHLKNSPHFWKTFFDWHRMKAAGCTVRPEYREFLKQREKDTYAYKHPSLNQSKDNFFGEDMNKYQYDHDSIHEAVAIMEKPAYRAFQKDEAEVACSKDKFFACSREVQLNSVVEESAVLAIERGLVPHPGKWTPKKAWLFALSKVCTSIASGWWRAFAYENGLDVLKRYPEGYYERFLDGVKTGLVREAP